MLDPNLLTVLAMGLLAAFLLRRTFRRLGGRRKSEPAIARQPRPAEKSRRLGDAPDDIARYEVELHETARVLMAQLDSKMAALNVLVQQADSKIARLETLLGATPPSAAEASPSEKYTGEHAEIFTLAAQGFSAATIAHRTQTPLAEVERILQGERGASAP